MVGTKHSLALFALLVSLVLSALLVSLVLLVTSVLASCHSILDVLGFGEDG